MYSEFDNLKESDILKIIAIIGLSDGTLNKKKNYIRLVTSDKSECLHDVFKYLSNKISKNPPRTCITRFKSGFTGKIENHIQTTLTSENIFSKLIKLNPSYKTTKGKLSKENFLKETQPNLKFLKNSPKEVKWLAFRLWFDFDGCIIPSFRLKYKKEKRKEIIYNYYQVQFETELRIAETNPSLVEDLIKLCNTLGLRTIKKHKKKNWSGLDGIAITHLADVKEFCKKGLITEVKISDKSPRFSGIEKRKVCNAVLKIIEDENIKKSKYFKNQLEAIEYKERMDKILFKLVQE